MGDEHKIKSVYGGWTEGRKHDAFLADSRVYTREDALCGALIDTDYIFSTWGMPAFSREEISACFKNLKAVFYAAGSVQHFARPFLECGIAVCSAYKANALPVTEYAVSQILLAAKGFFSLPAVKSRRDFSAARSIFSAFPGNYGAKAGIIGAGTIGRMVVEQLRQHDVEVYIYDAFFSDNEITALGGIKAGLKDIFSCCDVISNHLADCDATRGILNGELFRLMKQNAVFINTGCGAQVDEAGLCEALSSCPARRAVLDVTYPEPPADGSPLYELENVIITPHIAGSSGLEVRRMAEYSYEDFKSLTEGLEPSGRVTLKMLETMA